jgi:hypothetical protein
MSAFDPAGGRGLSYGDAMVPPVRVMLEQGKKKRVVACAVSRRDRGRCSF